MCTRTQQSSRAVNDAGTMQAKLQSTTARRSTAVNVLPTHALYATSRCDLTNRHKRVDMVAGLGASSRALSAADLVTSCICCRSRKVETELLKG